MQDTEILEFFDIESGKNVRFEVLERTVFGGEDFLLVTDPDTEADEEMAYIMRALITDDQDYTYEMVDDDELLAVLSGIFQELLEDTEIHS